MDQQLTFQADRHEYRLGGAVIPSVTQLLDKLHTFAGVPVDVLAAAAERGTAVHRTCELWDLDDLDETDLDERLAGYLEGWKRFTEEMRPEWKGIEVRRHHPVYRFAGTWDRHGLIRGEDWTVDIKTAQQSHPVWGVQTAAYNHLRGAPGAKRATVQLAADGTYRFRTWTDAGDWPVFVSLITLNNFSKRIQ